MATQTRNVLPGDLPQVLALNETEVPHVGRVDMDRMLWFAEHADYFRVIVDADRLHAFLIGMRPGSSYASPNYRWFCDRYTDFAYVDRVAVAPHARRRGLATILYDDFAAAMRPTARRMTCEVNVCPPNEQSMRFHLQLGFREVGTLSSDDGHKKVALLSKPL